MRKDLKGVIGVVGFCGVIGSEVNFMGLSAESKEVKKWFHETAEKKWKLLLPYMRSMDFDVFGSSEYKGGYFRNDHREIAEKVYTFFSGSTYEEIDAFIVEMMVFNHRQYESMFCDFDKEKYNYQRNRDKMDTLCDDMQSSIEFYVKEHPKLFKQGKDRDDDIGKRKDRHSILDKFKSLLD